MKKKAGFLALIPILYFAVSGGPYGLEEIVSSVGPFYALLLILVVPVIWSIPEALIVGELSSNYPVQGGYYRWVKLALGNFWGFLEGWWSILYTLIDISLYPILVTTYLKLLFPNMSFLVTYLLQLLVIWSCAIINILGIRAVGRTLAFFQSFIFLLFTVFVVVGSEYISFDFKAALDIPQDISSGGILLGFSLAFWNYIGLDGGSTVLGEIENPRKNYYKALFVLIPLIACFYFFPILIGTCIHQDWQSWSFGEYTRIAQTMNISWLAVCLTIGGMVTFLGLFNSLILTSTRLISTMSEDGYLPKIFSRLDKKSNAPVIAIIFVAFVYSFLVLVGFHKLLIYDVFFFLIAMFLEAISLLVLRYKNKTSKDCFKIPFGNLGLYSAVGIASMAIIFMTLLNLYFFSRSPNLLAITIFLILSGIPVYMYNKQRRSLMKDL